MNLPLQHAGKVILTFDDETTSSRGTLIKHSLFEGKTEPTCLTGDSDFAKDFCSHISNIPYPQNLL